MAVQGETRRKGRIVSDGLLRLCLRAHHRGLRPAHRPPDHGVCGAGTVAAPATPATATASTTATATAPSAELFLALVKLLQRSRTIAEVGYKVLRREIDVTYMTPERIYVYRNVKHQP